MLLWFYPEDIGKEEMVMTRTLDTDGKVYKWRCTVGNCKCGTVVKDRGVSLRLDFEFRSVELLELRIVFAERIVKGCWGLVLENTLQLFYKRKPVKLVQ